MSNNGTRQEMFVFFDRKKHYFKQGISSAKTYTFHSTNPEKIGF